MSPIEDGLEKCDRCGVLGRDRRTLWMSCLYDMNEFHIPFTGVGVRGWLTRELRANEHGWREFVFDESFDPEKQRTLGFYTLRVCKGCRGDWLNAIQSWFTAPPSNSAVANNDSSDAICTKQSLLAEITRLRTEAQAILQRAQDTENDLRNRLQETLDADKP